MTIITHRGLEPSRTNFYPESSFEAFSSQLDRGFGIEFDPYFLADRILVSHSTPLTTSPSLVQVLDLIHSHPSPKLSALHLKGKFQSPHCIAQLTTILSHYRKLLPRIIIFDVKPETALEILDRLPQAQLAPSVADPQDIARYNFAVLGTLISVSDALKYQDRFTWVWLDEWGLNKFYTPKTFATLKNVGYNIALVTPELHGTSPGLLGGEAHPDAQPQERLMARIREIIDLGPDAICTDYPEEIKRLLNAP